MFGMMEALLSFFRRQVGLRTDAADASGSLHAKVKDVKDYSASKLNNIPGGVWGHNSRSLSTAIPSSTVRLAANTERSAYSAVMKRIQAGIVGTIRVTFDAGGYGYVMLRVFRLGIENSTFVVGMQDVPVNSGGSYTAISIDVHVIVGDIINITTQPSSDQLMKIRNFRLCWDYSANPITGAVIDD